MDKKVKDELKTTIPFFLSLVPFLIGIIGSLLVLPENCSLSGNPEGPFSCDAIPNNCCGDKMTVTFAQIVFGLGVGLSIASFIILWQKDSQKHSQNDLKIFD